MAGWNTLFDQARAAFTQQRYFERVRTFGLSALTCLGRRTLSGLLCATGQQFRDRPPGGLPAQKRRPPQLSESRLPDFQRSRLSTTADPASLSVALGDRRFRRAHHAAFFVFVYALLLSALENCRLAHSSLPRPRWQRLRPRRPYPRITTPQAISLLRADLWASALGLQNKSGFVALKAAFNPKQPAIRCSLCFRIAKHKKGDGLNHSLFLLARSKEVPDGSPRNKDLRVRSVPIDCRGNPHSKEGRWPGKPRRDDQQCAKGR